MQTARLVASNCMQQQPPHAWHLLGGRERAGRLPCCVFERRSRGVQGGGSSARQRGCVPRAEVYYCCACGRPGRPSPPASIPLSLHARTPPSLTEHAGLCAVCASRQAKIFGGFVRWFFDLAPPSAEVAGRTVLTAASTAYRCGAGARIARAREREWVVQPMHGYCKSARERLAPPGLPPPKLAWDLLVVPLYRRTAGTRCLRRPRGPCTSTCSSGSRWRPWRSRGRPSPSCRASCAGRCGESGPGPGGAVGHGRAMGRVGPVRQ